LIDDVTAKLPCRAFEMTVNPDVDGYQTTPDNNCILLN